MIEIKFDPSTLTRSQREDLASFILGWGTDEEYENVYLQQAGRVERKGVNIELESPKSAPLSVDAGPSLTAPVDTQVNTLTGIAPPPPVPQPVFPANTAVPQSPNPAEVDSKGMPWDARIHSSSKAKVADGSWKYKRGVSEEEVKLVEAELHNPTLEELFTKPIAATSNGPVASEAFTAPGGIPSMQGAGTGVTGIVLPPPSGASEPDLRKEFAQLMIRVAQAKGAGKITAEEVTAALAAHAVPSLPMLSTKLDLVPSVAAAIDEIIASRG